MRQKALSSFAMYYGSGLPWLLFHAYLAYDAAVAIHQRFEGSR
jgi:hypothetical protein